MKLWEQYIVYVKGDIGFDIPLCGLCGNSGVVDTTASAKCFNRPAGIKTYCICPNGRAQKKSKKQI